MQGTLFNFGIGELEDGRKVPLVIFKSGDIQVTFPFDPNAADQVAAALAIGIQTIARAAIQANGGLIIPTGVNIDFGKPNGENGGI